MIYKKKWSRGKNHWRTGYCRHTYVGWFLFGIIPLFIVREGTPG